MMFALGAHGHEAGRFVTFKDAAGQVHQIWACVEFVAFQVGSVRWRAENTGSLPPAVLAISENVRK